MNDSIAKATPASTIPERAKELASDVGREVLQRANEQGQRGMKAAGEGLARASTFVGTDVGNVIDESSLPGVKREHAEKVASGLQSAASYLETHDPQSAVLDMDAAIRRHPYRAVAVGLGLGYVLGRLFRSDR